MRDELFDRDYLAGRAALHQGIDRLIGNFSQALNALHRIQFDAPWRSSPRSRSKRIRLA